MTTDNLTIDTQPTSQNAADDLQVGLSPQEVLKTLQERFPKAFPLDPKEIHPLKVGIHTDILNALGEQYSKRSLRNALRFYTGSPEYLDCLKTNAPRIDLEGNVCGEVTEKHLEGKSQRESHLKQVRLFAEAMPGKLWVTVKIKELPTDVEITADQHHHFTVTTPEAQQIEMLLSAKTWDFLEKTIQKYTSWIAVFSGKMNMGTDNTRIEIIDPRLQVFERNKVSEESSESMPTSHSQPSFRKAHSTNASAFSSLTRTSTTPPIIRKHKPIETKPPIASDRPVLSLKKKPSDS